MALHDGLTDLPNRLCFGDDLTGRLLRKGGSPFMAVVMLDLSRFKAVNDTYRRMGFSTAIDDFGAGHAGIALLSRFQTDIVKLDMALIRDLDTSIPRRMIVEGLVRMFERMSIAVVAEGIETFDEYEALCSIGVRYMQGYLFARPGFRKLPVYELPQTELRHRVSYRMVVSPLSNSGQAPFKCTHPA